MKNTKKLFLSLSAMVCVLGLAACGGTSTALPPSNSGSGSNTPSTSTPAPAENTFGEGITDDEKAFFPSLISGTGDFTKNTDFAATGSLTDRFDVKVGGTLKYIIYKGAKANGFGIDITAYIGVDVSTFQISGFKTVGDVHSYDTSADISSLPLVGTDGNITVANGSMSGSTVSANTLVDIAKEAVAQAKVDAGSSTTENTFGDGITADEKEIFPGLISGTGDFTKNTDFTATGSLTDRFDVKVSDTLKYIIYKGSKANGFGVNITAYIGVDVSTFQISGFKTVGDVHSEGSNFDISSLPLAGTDGNITVENGSMGGATVSANTLVAIAKEAVAQAKADIQGTITQEEVAALDELAGAGTWKRNVDLSTSDVLVARYDVTENGAVTKVIYKGTVTLPQKHPFVAYVAVDVNTHLITGYKTIGDVVSSSWSDYASSFEGWEDKFVGTDGSTVADTVAGATKTSEAFKTVAKAAVAQSLIDYAPKISEEEIAAIESLAGDGTYEENENFTPTDTLTARYDVTENGVVTKVIYKGTVTLPQKHPFVAYVAVDVNTKLITGYEVIGDVVSSAWTDHASSFEGWEDKFIGTDGSTVTDTVASATLTSNAFKNIAKAAVAQAIIDFE